MRLQDPLTLIFGKDIAHYIYFLVHRLKLKELNMTYHARVFWQSDMKDLRSPDVDTGRCIMTITGCCVDDVDEFNKLRVDQILYFNYRYTRGYQPIVYNIKGHKLNILLPQKY